MLDRPKVYVAGPCTRPDPCENTHRAITVANALWGLGFTPFVPHLSHFWHTVSPRAYDDWLAYDFVWLKECDVMLRLPGESSGADKEAEFAESRGIPVLHSVEELQQWAASR